jgi:hypothetical protein
VDQDNWTMDVSAFLLEECLWHDNCMVLLLGGATGTLLSFGCNALIWLCVCCQSKRPILCCDADTRPPGKENTTGPCCACDCSLCDWEIREAEDSNCCGCCRCESCNCSSCVVCPMCAPVEERRTQQVKTADLKWCGCGWEKKTGCCGCCYSYKCFCLACEHIQGTATS